jgi:hypothetical protein
MKRKKNKLKFSYLFTEDYDLCLYGPVKSPNPLTKKEWKNLTNELSRKGAIDMLKILVNDYGFEEVENEDATEYAFYSEPKEKVTFFLRKNY